VAEVSVRFAGERSEQAAAADAERFLTWPRLVAVGVFVLFAASVDLVKVQDDGAVYFDFLRRFFGVPTGGVAYQFGNAFWNAPFWLASQLVAVRGGFDHFQSGQVAVTVAANCAILVTLYLGWRILRELDLPRGGAILLLALFGTPLWFYGVLEPSYKHAADTLYATAAFWFLLRSSRDDAKRREYLAAGFCLALLLATRYANAGLVLGVLVTLWAVRLRAAARWIALATAVSAVAIFILPLLRHIPYASPPPNTYGLGSTDAPAAVAPPSQRTAAGVVQMNVYLPRTSFDPAAPFKMLFTVDRGVFLWTPLTFFATIGFVLLLRRDRFNRPFLLTLAGAAVGLLAIHTSWGGAWDGYGSFSNRFLTALFAVFLIGTAEFVRRTRRLGTALLTVCACFSLWVGLALFTGYYQESRFDSLDTVIRAYHRVTGPPISRFHRPPPYNSLQNFGRLFGDRFSHRWQLYWRLLS